MIPAMATYELGRVTMDDRGIRQGKVLGLFGAAFDLPWTAITGWAIGADVVASHAHPQGQVMAWVLELDHPGGTEVVRWGRSEETFHTFAAALGQRLRLPLRPPRLPAPARPRAPRPRLPR